MLPHRYLPAVTLMEMSPDSPACCQESGTGLTGASGTSPRHCARCRPATGQNCSASQVVSVPSVAPADQQPSSLLSQPGVCHHDVPLPVPGSPPAQPAAPTLGYVLEAVLVPQEGKKGSWHLRPLTALAVNEGIRNYNPRFAF